MPIRLFSTLLIMLGIFSASAQETNQLSTELSTLDQGFTLIPTTLCKDKAYESLCKSLKFPAAMEGRVLEIRNAEVGLAYFAPTNGVQDDHYELTCYRCSFGKIGKKDCGRYKDIHGNTSWAKNCPKKP